MVNVDLNEIKKFKKLTKKWWDLEGSMKPLHAINPVRMEYITSQMTVANKKVLDIGCGAGILSEEMSKSYAKVTAIDLNKDAIELAKERALQKNLPIDYKYENLENLVKDASYQNYFDLVTCMEVLEHVPNPLRMLKNLSKIIKKPSGKIIISTVNRTTKSYLGAIIFAEYILKILPKGTHEYRKFIKPSELENWGRIAGLDMFDIKGIAYNPILNTACFTESIGINYMVCYRASC